jgi:hypothetical protein
MVNMLENSGDKQIRMRHVDCDFIIQRDGIGAIQDVYEVWGAFLSLN